MEFQSNKQCFLNIKQGLKREYFDKCADKRPRIISQILRSWDEFLTHLSVCVSPSAQNFFEIFKSGIGWVSWSSLSLLFLSSLFLSSLFMSSLFCPHSFVLTFLSSLFLSSLFCPLFWKVLENFQKLGNCSKLLETFKNLLASLGKFTKLIGNFFKTYWKLLITFKFIGCFFKLIENF